MQLQPTKIIKTPYHLTQSGIGTLRKRLEDLRQSRAKHIEGLRLLKEQQSDSQSLEDSSLIQTLSTIRFLESEIDTVDYVLANAAVVEKPKEKTRIVGIGSRVRLKAGNREVEYTIVDSIEADPLNGKISDESPIGQQLLGKKVQDFVTIHRSPRQKPLSFRVLSTN